MVPFLAAPLLLLLLLLGSREERHQSCAGQPSCVRFDIADTSVVTPGNDSMQPEQLQPFQVGRHEAQGPPTRGTWQAVWAEMGSPAAREGAAGWRNDVAGKPGEWAPFTLKSDDDVRDGGAAPNRRDFVWLRSWPVIDERV
eukprot:COSAG06_NODE_156_length_21863_cov_29.245405_12_plen_141_part_00